MAWLPFNGKFLWPRKLYNLDINFIHFVIFLRNEGKEKNISHILIRANGWYEKIGENQSQNCLYYIWNAWLKTWFMPLCLIRWILNSKFYFPRMERKDEIDAKQNHHISCFYRTHVNLKKKEKKKMKKMIIHPISIRIGTKWKMSNWNCSQGSWWMEPNMSNWEIYLWIIVFGRINCAQ